MKKIILSITLAVVFAASLFAQVDRSTQPEPRPAPTIQIGDYDTFTLDNGLRVIVVENDKTPSVSYQLSLDLDPILEGEAKGYVSMAGSEMRSGTSNRDKATLDEEIDFIGASLSTSSTGMFASALSRHTETILELMADVLMNPTFPEEELEKSKRQTISGLQTVKTDANSISRNVATSVVYGHDHPYGEVTTEETVENIQRDLLVDYYNTYFKPNLAHLVIVGDITTSKAKKLVKEYFGDWESGEVPTHEYEVPTPPEGNTVAFANRSGAVQSVFSVTYPINRTPGHPDAIKSSVMNSILGGGVFSGRLMQNLREDKGYTYGARSNLGSDEIVARFSAGAQVGTGVTDSAIHEVLFEMERMINEPVDEESLQLVKNFMNGSFARSLESPRTIARFALNIERYDLPEDYYATYLEKLEKVTVEDVQEMARKYLMPQNAYIVVAGDEDEVPETIAKFAHNGMVNYYDHFGRPIEKMEVELDESITAEWIVEQYIEAIGGKSNINNIKDLKMVLSAEVMGSQMEMTTYKMAPGKMVFEMAVGGNTMQREVFDGEKGFQFAMGQRQDLQEDDIEAKKIQALMVKELSYLQDSDIEMELKGVDEIDGRQVYRIRVVTPDGTATSEYYDTETHLKTREVVTMEQMGQSSTITTDYGDYQEVGDIMFPKSVTILGAMPMPLEMTADVIEVNSGLDESMFEVE